MHTEMTACLLYCDHGADIQKLLDTLEEALTEVSVLRERVEELERDCDPPTGAPV